MERDAQVDILSMSKDISYAGCGLPYYVGDLIHERSELVVNTPEKFCRFDRSKCEIGGGSHRTKPVSPKPSPHWTTRPVRPKSILTINWSLPPGCFPIIPPVEGIHLKNVFVMRTPDDAVALRDAIEAGGNQARRRGRSRLYWPGSSRKSSRKGNSDYRHRHGPSDPAAVRP